jgi:hypothetical protein
VLVLALPDPRALSLSGRGVAQGVLVDKQGTAGRAHYFGGGADPIIAWMTQ